MSDFCAASPSATVSPAIVSVLWGLVSQPLLLVTVAVWRSAAALLLIILLDAKTRIPTTSADVIVRDICTHGRLLALASDRNARVAECAIALLGFTVVHQSGDEQAVHSWLALLQRHSEYDVPWPARLAIAQSLKAASISCQVKDTFTGAEVVDILLLLCNLLQSEEDPLRTLAEDTVSAALAPGTCCNARYALSLWCAELHYFRADFHHFR